MQVILGKERKKRMGKGKKTPCVQIACFILVCK